MNRLTVTYLSVAIFFIFSFSASSQKILDFQGQLAGYGQYAPTDDHYFLTGGRYLPQLNIFLPNDTAKCLDFELALDISGYRTSYHGRYAVCKGNIDPYRFWVRYRHKQMELRLGLQKIDFGSSTLLRPLQWFNSMDPRDPLKITKGVWRFLGRYYWLNNANLWFWCLTMNDDLRGLDIFHSHKYLPEFGGRVQYPVSRGEVAFSYNHRWIDAGNMADSVIYKQVQADHFALDGKWDVEIGLWFEATHSFLHRPLLSMRNQTAINMGADYTFGVGNGLNVLVEHLFMTYDEKAFQFKNRYNVSAMQINYPLALFDTVSAMGYYNWEDQKASFFLSYLHSFKKL